MVWQPTGPAHHRSFPIFCTSGAHFLSRTHCFSGCCTFSSLPNLARWLGGCQRVSGPSPRSFAVIDAHCHSVACLKVLHYNARNVRRFLCAHLVVSRHAPSLQNASSAAFLLTLSCTAFADRSQHASMADPSRAESSFTCCPLPSDASPAACHFDDKVVTARHEAGHVTCTPPAAEVPLPAAATACC